MASSDRVSINDKNSRVDLPMSHSSTETASLESVSAASLMEPHPEEPKWPQSWRAYACVIGCFFLMFNSWGLVNAYGTFASYYVGHSLRGNDQLELNLIGSTQSFLVLLFSAPVGRLLDAGHFRWVTGTGAFFVPFGMFMLSVAHPSNPDATANYARVWVTQGFVVGLGMACFFVSSSQVAATWFPNRKGLAVGFVACGASIAGVVYPAMTRFLIQSQGFNTACRLVATLVTITSAFAFFFSTPNPTHTHPRPQSYRSLKTWIDPEAFRNKAFCWFTAAITFLFFGFYPVFFNLEEWAAVSGYGTRDGSYAATKGIEPDNKPLETFWLLTIMNGASTAGRATMATFSDKTGPLNMHIIAQVISSLFVLILWALARSTSAAIVFCVFFGMTSGAVIGLPPASMANILNCTYNTPATKVIGHSKLGQWVGMMYSVAAIPSLVGPVVAGHLVTRYSDYITVQAWSGANLMISAFCMIVTRWYLPCADGEHVKTKLARILGKHEDRSAQDIKARPAIDSDNEGDRGFSQATARITSEAQSQQQSDEKVGASRRGLLGSDQNV